MKNFYDNKLKTTLATLYPNSILLACEPGYKAKKVNFKKITKWEEFIEFIDLVEDKREEIAEEIKTITIDTADRLFPYCQDFMVRKYNRRKHPDLPKAETIGDIPHGKGWSSNDEEFLKQLLRLLDLGFTYLFITHNKVKTITPKNGTPYDVYVPTMADRCAQIIYPLVDFIINGERIAIMQDGEKVSKRVINLRGNEMSDCGSRVGDIDEKIIFDTEEEAMEKFRESFKNAIEKEVRKNDKNIDMVKLSKSQDEQKKEEVKKVLQKTKELPELITEIKATMKAKLKDKAITNGKIMEILGNYSVKSPQEIDDIETAKAILGELGNSET